MGKSTIFFSGKYKEIERQIVMLVNTQEDFLSAATASSPRATGDAIQGILSDQFEAVLGDLCAEYSASFARRAMADLAFSDCDGFYYVVDVKAHRIGAAFSMPNLTSVERLARFYEDDNNYFITLVIDYEISRTQVKAVKAHFIPIEFLAWNCLTIGALGWGQIQITNANIINVNDKYPRKKWMLELCDIMLDFYPGEISKISGRIEYFQRVRERWLGRVES